MLVTNMYSKLETNICVGYKHTQVETSMTGCQRWASTLTTERGSPCRVEQSHSVGKHTMRRKMLRSRGKKTTVFDYVKMISKLCRDNVCLLGVRTVTFTMHDETSIIIPDL